MWERENITGCTAHISIGYSESTDFWVKGWGIIPSDRWRRALINELIHTFFSLKTWVWTIQALWEKQHYSTICVQLLLNVQSQCGQLNPAEFWTTCSRLLQSTHGCMTKRKLQSLNAAQDKLVLRIECWEWAQQFSKPGKKLLCSLVVRQQICQKAAGWTDCGWDGCWL